MFKPVNPKVDFPAMERDILAWWEENGIVDKYLHRNDAAEKRFSFIDGPITANNPMGVHHAWGRTYKDLWQRYKTMQGYRQRYQNGFDGQGLWIEVEVEKQLGLNSKRDIEKFGVDRFVELCKERVRKFAGVQTEQSIRLGYWMNWDDSYHTMSDENNYTIWHFLKVCHERGWIYEGTDVMPWCPRCGTGLSQHEIVTEGYKEITHPGLYVRFPLIGASGSGLAAGEAPTPNPQSPDPLPESLLVWTTTPWTLTSNTAAAVHPDLTYVKVRSVGSSPSGDDELLYLLKSRLFELKTEYEVLEEMPGSALVGRTYRSPFDELPAQQGVEHRVVPWDEVSESEGTGIVHSAPGAGQEDFALSKEHGLAVIAPLDEFGVFVDGFDWLTGMSVFEVNKPIYQSLRGKGLLFRLDQYTHRYPVCWRCDTELVFRLVDEWFISMGDLYDKPREELTPDEKAGSLRYQIMDVVDRIQWVPGFGHAREMDWLRNMHDWMISKKRYWGLALPLYKCESCGHFEVIGSETELEERAVEGWSEFNGNSPHRPWIDAVKVQCTSCGATVSRIPDVGNVWLDAGIVPFSTLDYRHDRDHWKDWFPADWISESFPGQFRNWFYSLLCMSTVLENAEPFRTLFSYALMRDEKGEEMHKSKGNAIWFEDAAERMGVDSMRWMYMRQNPAANLSFGFGTADDVRRQVLIPLWNVYSFFVTYANIDGYDPHTPAPEVGDRPELDRWIVSELNSLMQDVTAGLEGYEPEVASHAVERFVEHLSNWYVRRSRRRFWKSDADDDKQAAHATLYECLVTLTRLLAPMMPFITEEMYQNLVGSVNGGKESVHLEDYPVADPSKIDQGLSEATRLAMRLSSLGRAARSRAGIKVRQPVARALVKLREPEEGALLERVAMQVREELNIKELSVMNSEAEVVEFEVKANMALVGPKYASEVSDVLRALSAADATDVWERASSKRQVAVEGYTLEPEEVLVTTSDREGFSVADEAGYAVAIATALTPELELEGEARELVHGIQNMRRSAGFDIADYIVTYYQSNEKLDEVLAKHGDYVRGETLSRELINEAPPEDAYAETHSVSGVEVVLGVVRR